MQVARRSKAKPPHLLHLKRSDPRSDLELAHREAPPRLGPSASSSSSVAQIFAAAQGGKVARACERVRGVPCYPRIARDRAAHQNAAVDGAVLMAQEKAAHWDHGIAMHASAVVAISAALTVSGAQEAAAAGERREAEAAAQEAAAAREARAAQGVIAKKESN